MLHSQVATRLVRYLREKCRTTRSSCHRPQHWPMLWCASSLSVALRSMLRAPMCTSVLTKHNSVKVLG